MRAKNIDLQYLCTAIGNLSGIPIRLYRGRELLLYYSVSPLPKDPICVYFDQIMAIEDRVGYFMTQHFNYYGVVTSGAMRVVLGPSRQTTANEQELRELAFRADVPKEQINEFVLGMKNIVSMPLGSIIQILLTLNHVLNGEKLSLADITVYDGDRERLKELLSREQIKETEKRSMSDEANRFNNSLATEQTILTIVRHGDTAALKKWLADAPAVNSGILAKELIRQQKNTFIVTATLVCRAAIRGGVDMQDALSMSDSYIQKCELLQDLTSITHLLFRMVFDYTERVEKMRRNAAPSQLVFDVRNYILHHLSEPIRTSAIAETLFISRSKLSSKFKSETGENLSDFILREKTEEAKYLLRYTDKTLVSIGTYLGFSSQSHFARTFKKYAGLTPADYRERNQ